MSLTAAIAGASGYAGGEVIRLLLDHPHIRPTTFTAHSNAGHKMGKVQPHLRAVAGAELLPTTPENLAEHDIVFLALPHGKSGQLAEQISRLSPNTLIVDCGADHRLHEESDWDAFYGGAYSGAWSYGVPELLTAEGKQRDNLKGTKRIAAPGCNASAVALALAPAVQGGLVDVGDIVATLVVGPSGAGKTLKPNLLASEILGSASPYAVGGIHRHIPEIRQALRETLPEGTRPDIRISFTPVLVPMARGILAIVSAPMLPGVSEDELRRGWERAYADERFVELLPVGEQPATASTLGANLLQLSVSIDHAAGRVVVIAALDNLTKGTAGAAIQSANVALGLEESSGLTVNGVAP